MTDTKRRLIGMGIPFLLAFGPDTALAIGSRSTTLDGLLFQALLRLHPQALLLGFAAWAFAVTGLLLLLPEVLAVVLTIAAVFGHAAGAYLQLTGVLGGWWYQAANGLFLIAAIALGTGLTWWARVQDNSGNPGKLPKRWRWGLVVLFSTVASSAVLHR
jgi:hypothetical protein